MRIFSFFSASSQKPLSTSSTINDDLFPSTVIIPSLPSQNFSNVTTPVIVFPQGSQQTF